MSNSPLVSYTLISPHHTSPRESKIDLITIHCMAGNLSVEGCGNCFVGGNVASSNYGVDGNGKVGMYVDERDRAYTSSNSTNDARAVTIEVANDGGEPDWHVSDMAMATTVLLCADICKRNGIAGLKFDPSDESHPTTPNGNMTLHRWFAAKACPGDYLVSNMSKIATSVNMLLESGETSFTWGSATASGNITGGTIGVSTGSSSESSGGPPTLHMDISTFNPFVVTIPPQITNIKYDKLRDEMQVCGCLFEAGYLFDITHKIVPFRNKNLYKQVKGCNKAGLRFGLYTYVRSRTLDEAKEECKQLYYCISKYPPGMGVWLQLQFPKGQSKSKNHAILDLYIERLTEWGLLKGCGLYCTREQLELIDWDEYQDKFLLWYINMFTSENQFEQVEGLMYPEFFQLDPKDPQWTPNVTTDPVGTNSGNLIQSGSTGSSVDPSNVPQSVWNFFISRGYTPEMTAGIMGNMRRESYMSPYTVQGSNDGNANNPTNKSYIDKVDNGTYSESQFVHDSIGFGIVQYTFSGLKQMLYTSCKQRGVSISDLQTQLEEIDKVIFMPDYCADLGNYVKKPGISVDEATILFEQKYEKAGVVAMQDRLTYAHEYYNQFANKTIVTSTTATKQYMSNSRVDKIKH